MAKGGGSTLDRPQGASGGSRKKILYTKVGVANNFAIGPRGGPHAKTGDTVFRLSGLAKGGGLTLDRPQGASGGSRKKILYTKVGVANNFAIGPRGGPHVKS